MNTSISTDDPGLMLTTLLSDYDVATEKYGFSEEDLKNLVSISFFKIYILEKARNTK